MNIAANVRRYTLSEPKKRNRATAKKAGSSFEKLVADYLAFALNDDRIERRAKNGQLDRGDITGCTRRINGGTNGLRDRIKYWDRARAVLVVDMTTARGAA